MEIEFFFKISNNSESEMKHNEIMFLMTKDVDDISLDSTQSVYRSITVFYLIDKKISIHYQFSVNDKMYWDLIDIPLNLNEFRSTRYHHFYMNIAQNLITIVLNDKKRCKSGAYFENIAWLLKGKWYGPTAEFIKVKNVCFRDNRITRSPSF